MATLQRLLGQTVLGLFTLALMATAPAEPVDAANVVLPSMSAPQHPGRDGTLMVATSNAIELVSPTTGAVLHSVPIPDSYRLAYNATSPDSQMAVAPDGKAAFVAVIHSPMADHGASTSPMILEVPLDGGRVTVTATDAEAPSISPDGKSLAYLEYPLPGGAAGNGLTENLVTLNLVSRAQRTINLSADYEEANGPVGVNGLSWSPSGSTLAIATREFADVYGEFDDVRLLNPLHPIVAFGPRANPTLLRVAGGIPAPATNPSQFIDGYQAISFMPGGDVAVIDAEIGQADPLIQSRAVPPHFSLHQHDRELPGSSSINWPSALAGSYIFSAATMSARVAGGPTTHK
jgi:hypothetical protein